MKNIVMTGGTSGIGLETSKKLLDQTNVKLFLGYRSSGVEGANNILLDLASLSKVKTFSEKIISKLNGDKIDVLICNAGVNHPSNDKRTDDGIEMNVGVNHIAHFYLIQLLTPYLDQNAKISMTTSGTIDPEKETLAPPPKHANVQWLAYPKKDKTLKDDKVPKGQRAYASSKICELLTAMQINKLNNTCKGITYDPGLTPGTGLLRHADEELKALGKQLDNNEALRKERFPESNSMRDAGETLADIALGKIQPPQGKYVALRGGNVKFITPPGLAKDQNLPEEVWETTTGILKNKLPSIEN
jgi:NAD(P)-dependent dehydrogenase (short-subunit alcohol dehydrogenase family)